MKHIFFVEDDLSLINGLSFALKKQGYEVTVARTVLEAKALWRANAYDLVILDVALPDGSGYDLCREIRRTSKVPLVFLTAADEETDMIMGLDIGGDDYITKPFKLAVFLSKVNALLRRSGDFCQADAELSSNQIRVRLLTQEVSKNGSPRLPDSRRVQAAVPVYGKPGYCPVLGADPWPSLGLRGKLYKRQYADRLYTPPPGQN